MAGPSRDPEEPAAHVSDYLALLPSGPDAVRRLRLHRVRAAPRPVTTPWATRCPTGDVPVYRRVTDRSRARPGPPHLSRGAGKPACYTAGEAAPSSCGEMSERLKEHAWKACVGVTLPWVRIPLSPPESIFCSIFFNDKKTWSPIRSNAAFPSTFHNRIRARTTSSDYRREQSGAPYFSRLRSENLR